MITFTCLIVYLFFNGVSVPHWWYWLIVVLLDIVLAIKNDT